MASQLSITSLLRSSSVKLKSKYEIQSTDGGSTLTNSASISNSLFSTSNVSSSAITVNKDIPSTEGQFQNMTWSEIDDMAKDAMKNPSDYAHMIGWTKDVVFGSPINKTVSHEIVDLCHTDWGDNHAFVFMPKYEVLTMAPHNTSYFNGLNYASSVIDTDLQENGNYWNSLPSDLAKALKECNIKYLTSASDTDWSGKNVSSLIRKWFLPSVVEMGLVSSAGAAYNSEGKVLQKFALGSASDRIRKRDTNTASGWWLRSICWDKGTALAFGGVFTSGTLYLVASYQSMGVVPCFAI